MSELIGWIMTAIAVAGVVLNNYRLRVCFLVWLVSNLISAGLHLHAHMWALTGKDIIFCVLAVHGYRHWGRAARKAEELVNITQGSAALEGQAVSPSVVRAAAKWVKDHLCHTTL